MASPHIGVVFNRSQGGAVSRIINPDFDWQLDLQVLSNDEYLLRVSKEAFGISGAKDGMTLDDVYRVCGALAP